MSHSEDSEKEEENIYGHQNKEDATSLLNMVEQINAEGAARGEVTAAGGEDGNDAEGARDEVVEPLGDNFTPLQLFEKIKEDIRKDAAEIKIASNKMKKKIGDDLRIVTGLFICGGLLYSAKGAAIKIECNTFKPILIEMVIVLSVAVLLISLETMMRFVRLHRRARWVEKQDKSAKTAVEKHIGPTINRLVSVEHDAQDNRADNILQALEDMKVSEKYEKLVEDVIVVKHLRENAFSMIVSVFVALGGAAVIGFVGHLNYCTPPLVSSPPPPPCVCPLLP